jgi:hypothetical protein
VPAGVRAAVEDALGTTVAGAQSQQGGFSPGAAARLRLADGRRVFVKAVGPELNPDSPGMHRREGAVAAALPATVPSPRLRHTADDGEWVALVFEDVDGRQPRVPWQRDELDRVLAAVAELVDLLAMLRSVAMQGRPDPAAVFAAHPVARAADDAAVTAVLCALTGFFVAQGRQPDPPGLPTLRVFQTAQGTHALRWLRGRLEG